MWEPDRVGNSGTLLSACFQAGSVGATSTRPVAWRCPCGELKPSAFSQEAMLTYGFPTQVQWRWFAHPKCMASQLPPDSRLLRLIPCLLYKVRFCSSVLVISADFALARHSVSSPSLLLQMFFFYSPIIGLVWFYISHCIFLPIDDLFKKYFFEKELILFATAWMELESIMLSEISQAVRDRYHMISPLTGT